MTRNLTLRKAILEILERAQPFALPEEQLKIELNGAVRPPAGDAEFDEQIAYLQGQRFIATVADPLDEQNVKWTITEPGKATLRQ